MERTEKAAVRPGAGEDDPRGAFFDVVVIGGGVVGCAVLRELSRYRLRLLLLEKETDLSEGTSKANSGVIHAGFNVPPGTLKAKTNVAGLARIYTLAGELGVPHRMTGKLVVAADEQGIRRLEELKSRGDRNGAPGLALVGSDEIRNLEPGVRGVRALYSPKTGIISPYEFTIALAECAAANGARVRLEAPVVRVGILPAGFLLGTPRGDFRARWVVNAAGLFSDEVAALARIAAPRIYPFRGEYLITDKEAGSVLRMPVYPVPPPGDSFLGVHVTPSLEGNILLGPSKIPVGDKLDTAVTKPVMESLKNEAFELVPGLRDFPFIHSYSGLRATLTPPAEAKREADFVVAESEERRGWVNICGIESPGLTAAPAIAGMIAEIIGSREDLEERPDFNPLRPAPPRFAHLEDGERARRSASDPSWGEMVCRCEQVTRAEVETALRNPFGAGTLDAVKRRTRCGMGRCQGGFCTPRIADILQERGLDPRRITKRGPGSELFYGRIKP
jgi:glycerol-3-phosphate dehydrogenase